MPVSSEKRTVIAAMENENYTGLLTETQEYCEETEEVVGFLSLEMADKLISLKVAEGFPTFEAFFEQLLKDHAAMKQLRG